MQFAVTLPLPGYLLCRRTVLGGPLVALLVVVLVFCLLGIQQSFRVLTLPLLLALP